MHSNPKKHPLLFNPLHSFVRFAAGIVNVAILVVLLLLFVISAYILWDSNSIYTSAAAKEYTLYKPDDPDDSASFNELKALNPEVIGWLTVYGTGIDYPLVQGPDNEKYLTKDALGKNTTYGAIFLDYKSKPDFSDFSSIVYGHHMAGNAMFGDIDLFSDETYFREHRYGNLYFDNTDHGLEFMMFLEVDAYDKNVYRYGVQEGSDAESYLQTLREKALHSRPVKVNKGEHIVLLSTCTANITNGRQILVAVIRDPVFENPFSPPEQNSSGLSEAFFRGRAPWSGIFDWPIFIWILLILWLILLVIAIWRLVQKKRNDPQKGVTDEKKKST